MKRRAQRSQTPPDPGAAPGTEPGGSVRVAQGDGAGRQVLVMRQRWEVARGPGEPKRLNRSEVGSSCGLHAGIGAGSCWGG